MQIAMNDQLDWAVSKRQLLFVNAEGDFSPVPNRNVIVREDNEAALGICADSYEPLQNEDLKSLVSPMVAEGVLTVENQGFLGNGKKVFVQLRVNKEFEVIGEEYQGYLTLLNSFDGTASVAIGPSMFRVVCGNTFAAAYSDLGERFRHTEGVTDRVLNTQSVVNFVDNAMKRYSESVETLSASAISAGQFEKAVEKIFQKKVSDMRESTVDKLNKLFYSGAGNEGRTAYDAFNAVTDFSSHHMRKTEAGNFYYSQFGQGANLSRRAMAVLSEMVAV